MSLGPRPIRAIFDWHTGRTCAFRASFERSSVTMEYGCQAGRRVCLIHDQRNLPQCESFPSHGRRRAIVPSVEWRLCIGARMPGSGAGMGRRGAVPSTLPARANLPVFDRESRAARGEWDCTWD